MMTSQDTGLALSAIHTYFDSERRELLVMVVGAVLFIAATALLLFAERDSFARGLFATVLVFGIVVGGGAVSLLVRDVGLREQLASSVAAEAVQPAGVVALDAEKTRVAVVISKFSVYRVAAVLIAALALAGMLLARGGWVHGVAAGLLLAAMAQVIIDHYSESRATTYLQRLVALPAR